MVIQQLLRGGAGYGGVERVAHELGTFWGGAVFSLDVQGHSSLVRFAAELINAGVCIR